MKKTYFVCAVFCIILVCCLSACNSNRIKGLVDCNGTITLNQELLDDAKITFIPLDSNGRSAYAVSNTEGKFRMATLDNNYGVLPGDYKVTIEKYIILNPEVLEEIKNNWKEIKKEILAGKPSPQPTVKRKNMTGKYSNIKTTELTVSIPAKGNKNLNIDLTIPESDMNIRVDTSSE